MRGRGGHAEFISTTVRFVMEDPAGVGGRLECCAGSKKGNSWEVLCVEAGAAMDRLDARSACREWLNEA